MHEQADERRETSLRDFVAVLFRRKWIVLSIFLAALAVVVALDATSPVFYESAAALLVSRGQPESAYTSRMKMVVSVEEELTAELETVKSAHILGMAQQILDENKTRDSMGIPVAISEGVVDATTLPKSSLIYVRSRHADPLAAQEITQAVTQAYSSFRLSVRTVPELETYFREEIEALRNQLEDWEQQRADFMNSESVVTLPEERNSLIALRQRLESDLTDVRSNLAAEQARYEVLRGLVNEAGDAAGVDVYPFSEGYTRDEQTITGLKTELTSTRAQYLSALGRYQEDHPLVQSLGDKTERLEALLKREMEAYLRHLQAKVEVLRAREETVLGAIAFKEAQLASFPTKEARLTALNRVIETLQSDYAAMSKKQIDARLERIGSPDWNILILQPAAAASAIRTNDMIRLALIPLVGLVVGIAFAFAVDGLDHSLKSAAETEQHLGLPVLGSVGRLR